MKSFLRFEIILTCVLVSIHSYSQNESSLGRLGFDLGVGTTINGGYVDENDEKVENIITPFTVNIGFLTKNKKNEFNLAFGKYLGLEYVFNFVGNSPKRIFPLIGVGGGITFVGKPGQVIKAPGKDETGYPIDEKIYEDGYLCGYLKPRIGLNIYVSKKTLLQPSISITQLSESTRLTFSIPIVFTMK